MGNSIVDDAKRVLSEAGIGSQCPKCGNRKMFVSYSREFIIDLDKETSQEAEDSGIDPCNITCYKCAEPIIRRE